jgi:streptomycin 6-kinase
MASAARPDAGAPFEPPQRLVSSLAAQGGEAGERWLRELPELLREALERWELTLERIPSPGGRSSLVALVRRADGTPAALKLPAPGAWRVAEPAALARWGGRGTVRLLDSAAGTGALLLERLRPEVSLRSLPEPKALLEAAETVQRLWVDPGEEPYESVEDRTGRAAQGLRAAAREPWAISARPLVEEAMEIREELTTAPPERLLLHGRFRQGKVLSGERLPWLAVGPAPVVGERAYDLARLVHDRLEDLVAAPGGAALARRRVARLADSLEVDADRLRGWALFRAVEAGIGSLAAGRLQAGELALEFAGWL